jgi:hypothetical protein
MMSSVEPIPAVVEWRAITLTFLARSELHKQQCDRDTGILTEQIFGTLATLLPPPQVYSSQLRNTLYTVIRLAVSMSIEMRTQRANYVMLASPRSEYDQNGDPIAGLTFNAKTMNERSGEVISDEELEAKRAAIKIVLFPILVKRGDDYGEGEEQTVVFKTQVLIANPNEVS